MNRASTGLSFHKSSLRSEVKCRITFKRAFRIRVTVKQSVIMAEKQLINSVKNCVEDGLYGFSRLHPHLFVDFPRKIVFDANGCARGRVALISGGGSGHEPFPAGFVGEGMLTASVSGPIFTSPPSSHLLHGIRLVSGKSSGVLLLVPNYTGDVLNFGLAAETALGQGITVETVIVGEDASPDVRGGSGKAGRRGMCGLILVIKIAGYLARTGHDLAMVKKLSLEAARSTASMGLCVSSCCKPGVGLLFPLSGDEMELGVGVHGEAGVARVKMTSAREAVKMLLEFVVRNLKVAEGDEVVGLLNNLGSLSGVEQWLLAGEVEKQLTEKKVKVVRLYSGCFFTSLNMAGVQVCILKLNRETKNVFLKALDHPTSAPAWTSNANSGLGRPVGPMDVAIAPEKSTNFISTNFRLDPESSEVFKHCLLKISEELKRQEKYLNNLDSACGDGDCGTTFAQMATLLNAAADVKDFTYPAGLFLDLSLTVGESIGGTTGALYGLFFKGCSKELEKSARVNNALVFSKCWRAGVETIKKYSSARLGDRTMLDSLETGCLIFEEQLAFDPVKPEEAFRSAVKAAAEGCQKTKHMEALAGRASYTVPSRQKDVDAGACAVTVWLSAILSVLDERPHAAHRTPSHSDRAH